MDAKPRRIWPTIVALLIGLPLCYAASLGPACWWATVPISSSSPQPGILRIYAPLGWMAVNAPYSIRGLVLSYAGLAVSPGYETAFPTDFTGDSWMTIANFNGLPSEPLTP